MYPIDPNFLALILQLNYLKLKRKQAISKFPSCLSSGSPLFPDLEALITYITTWGWTELSATAGYYILGAKAISFKNYFTILEIL